MDRGERRMERLKRDNERLIKAGLKLDLREPVPEGAGEQLVSDLRDALDSSDKEAVVKILKEIGDSIHRLWGNDRPTSAEFDELEEKFKLFLSSGTAGTRLSINTKSSGLHSGDLIFPNVNPKHTQKGKTLSQAFEELFGESAENVAEKGQDPYFVVSLSQENR